MFYSPHNVFVCCDYDYSHPITDRYDDAAVSDTLLEQRLLSRDETISTFQTKSCFSVSITKGTDTAGQSCLPRETPEI